ncbi:PAAR domain-containing protein [Cronobacter dublinensis]|uniref:PAAR domain-containing protein n=1 Tax=Cronobacter dublinensis TaxID=413497 RepID=UPI003D32CAE5
MKAISMFLGDRYCQVKVKQYFYAYLLKGNRMQGIVCLGDATNHGGKVITASSTMFINGIQVALVGDMVSCPFPGHGINPIIEGAPTDTEDGICVVVDNCLCACGCRVISSHPENCVES